jgi:WD40 repeat protein
MWDLHNRVCVNVFKGHTNGITCLKILQRPSFFISELIASGSEDETIKIWNSVSGECVHTLTGHVGSLFCLEFAKNLLISSGKDGTIRLWNSLNEWKCIRLLNGHTDNVYCLRINLAGHLVSGSKDKSLRIWNVETGECTRVVQTDACIYRFELYEI